MAKIPLDEGWPGRRRLGPFWLEEHYGYLLLAGLFLLAALLFYVYLIVQLPGSPE
jgi:hypothetical protein